MVIATFAAGACGGGGGAPDSVEIDCSYEPCGGDPVGSWSYVGRCLVSAPDYCPEELIRYVVELEGTLVLRADGTAQEDWVGSGDMVFHLPPACVPQAGCDDLDSSATDCHPDDGGCHCSTATPPMSGSQQSTWTKADDTSLVVNGGSVYSFCVEDDVLMISLDLLEGARETVILRR